MIVNNHDSNRFIGHNEINTTANRSKVLSVDPLEKRWLAFLERYSNADDSVVFFVDKNLRFTTQGGGTLRDRMRPKRTIAVLAIAALRLRVSAGAWSTVFYLKQ